MRHSTISLHLTDPSVSPSSAIMRLTTYFSAHNLSAAIHGAQVWGHEACLADLATASVDAILVVLLTALAVGLCRPSRTRPPAAAAVQPRQPTLLERALLLELTATLLLLVAWIRLVYAANDHGWQQLLPERCAVMPRTQHCRALPGRLPQHSVVVITGAVSCLLD